MCLGQAACALSLCASPPSSGTSIVVPLPRDCLMWSPLDRGFCSLSQGCWLNVAQDFRDSRWVDTLLAHLVESFAGSSRAWLQGGTYCPIWFGFGWHLCPTQGNSVVYPPPNADERALEFSLGLCLVLLVLCARKAWRWQEQSQLAKHVKLKG